MTRLFLLPWFHVRIFKVRTGTFGLECSTGTEPTGNYKHLNSRNLYLTSYKYMYVFLLCMMKQPWERINSFVVIKYIFDVVLFWPKNPLSRSVCRATMLLLLSLSLSSLLSGVEVACPSRRERGKDLNKMTAKTPGAPSSTFHFGLPPLPPVAGVSVAEFSRLRPYRSAWAMQPGGPVRP